MRHALFVLTAAILFAVPAMAQDAKAPRLEELVPEHTFFFASVPDLPGVTAQCKRTALAELWHEEEVQKFVAPLKDFLAQAMGEAEQQLGRPMGQVLSMFCGQVALAVVHFDPVNSGMVPDVVFFADLGASVEEFKALHTEFLNKAGQELGVKDAEYGGVKYMTMPVPPGIELCIGYLGSALVVTTRPERMSAVIDAVKGGLPTSLAANKTYQRVSEMTGGAGRMLDVFVNVESILGYFGGKIEPEAMKALNVSGIAGIKGIGYGSSFVAEGVRDTIAFYAPGEKKGMLALPYATKGLGTTLLARVPQNAFYATAGSMNLAATYGIMMEMLGGIEPRMLDQVTGYVQRFEELLGIRLVDDLLAPMGEDLAVYAALPDGGGLMPDLAVLLRPKDPAKLMATLDQMVAKFGAMAEDRGQYVVEHRTMSFSGRDIHYVHVAQRWGEPFPVTPCFVQDGELFVLALYPQVLKDFLARGVDAPSVLTRPDFARVTKGLPEGLVGIEYLDFQAAARLLYGSLAPFAQMLGKSAEIPIDVALLPRTETVAKHLFGLAGGYKIDPDGWIMHYYSTTGVMPFFIAAGAGMAFFATTMGGEMKAVMPPDFSPVPQPVEPEPPPAAEPVAAAKKRLDDIYIGLLFHYAQTKDYPAALGELVASQSVASEAALVLSDDPAPVADATGQKTSFAYVGPAVGRMQEGRDQLVWVYERDGLAADGRWVLFASGRVRRVAEDEFQRLLTETRSKLGK